MEFSTHRVIINQRVMSFWGVMVCRFCVRPASLTWVWSRIQSKIMKHYPLHAQQRASCRFTHPLKLSWSLWPSNSKTCGCYLITLLSLIRQSIYLIGVPFGEDQRANTINTHFSKEIGPPLHTQQWTQSEGPIKPINGSINVHLQQP